MATEHRIEYLKRYNREHREQHRLYMKAWREKNPERDAEYTRRSNERRAAARRAVAAVAAAQEDI